MIIDPETNVIGQNSELNPHILFKKHAKNIQWGKDTLQ